MSFTAGSIGTSQVALAESATPRRGLASILRNAAFALGLVLVGAPQGSASLLLSAEHRWGVATVPRPGWTTEYYICDDWGENCAPIGYGDALMPRFPISIDHSFYLRGRLRASFCAEVTLDDEEPLCTELSAAGPLFIMHPGVQPDEVLSVPDNTDDVPLTLVPGIPTQMRLPVGLSPPLSAELQLFVLGAEPVIIISLHPGSDPNRALLSETCIDYTGPVVFYVSAAVEEAVVHGEQEILLTLLSTNERVILAMGDPIEGPFPAPHIWLSRRPALGDACQCGDLDGSGQMDENDVAELRLHLAGFLSELAPKTYQRCPAPTPTGECNIGDVVRLERAIAGLEPDVGQSCPAATQPISP